MVETLVAQAIGILALTLEATTAIIIAIGATLALVSLVRGILVDASGNWKRAVWLQLASWLILALEFALAADICRTAIAPSWDDIGKLAVIAIVRTALNYFLAEDLEHLENAQPISEDSR